MFTAALFTIARMWKQLRCPSSDEWIKKLIFHIYHGILLSHKKECIWVSSSKEDDPRAYYTEWSKPERENQILYGNTYIWNLERWYRWTYLQGNNERHRYREQTYEHRSAVGEEGEVGTNGESNMEAYILPCVKQITNGNLLHDSGNSNWSSVTT